MLLLYGSKLECSLGHKWHVALLDAHIYNIPTINIYLRIKSLSNPMKNVF